MLSTPSYSSARLARRLLAACALLTIVGGAAACSDDDDDNGLTGPGSGVARGATVFGLDDQNNLVAFGLGNPTREAARRIAVTGLSAGERLVGIDFRANDANDRGLYGVTSGSRLVKIDTTSGAAMPIGATAFTPALTGTSLGFDFNPRADRIRLQGESDQNLRLNQLTGAVGAVDPLLRYAAGDVNANQNPAIVGTAYTNATPGPTTTELFAIDAGTDALVFLAAPNDGMLTTRGALGVNTTNAVGFDIGGSGVAYATLTTVNTSRSKLYTINLSNGTATVVGDVNHSRPLIGIAIAP